MSETAVRRYVAIAALVVLVAAEMALFLRPARADEGNLIDYTVGKPISVDEGTALLPDPVTHIELRTQPATCALLPTCRLFLLDMHYPANADPHTNYFTEIRATLHGSANYQLELFADPSGNSDEVSESTSTARTLAVHLVSAPIDPVQEFGITMYLVSGTLTPFTLSISSSTQEFPNPFESLNPEFPQATVPPASPTTITLPPVSVPTAPSTEGVPPPTAAPDQALAQPFVDNGQFSNGLAAPAAAAFKKTAATRPPGTPSAVQLWLALLALPVTILCLFPLLVRQRRDRDLL